MKCPVCGGEMKKGTLRGEGRLAPKWLYSGDKASLFGSGHIIKNFRRTGTVYETDGFLCERCGKAVIDLRL